MANHVSYISRFTGLPITELEHVEESIMDILTTTLQSRVMLAEYGCGIHNRVDDPVNREFIAYARMDIADALQRWEPRVSVRRVQLDLAELPNGIVRITLNCRYKPTGGEVTFESLELRFRRIAA